MAITRTQIARQLYQAGGGADFGAPDKAKDRASKGYGNVGGGKAASKGFKQDAGPGEQSPEVYGASGPYDSETAKAAAIAQGKFKKKNPIEKFVEGYTGGTRRRLYNIFPNNPRNELDYLTSLSAAQKALLSPALRAKLEELEDAKRFDDIDSVYSSKFTFDEFEDLRKFQPTEGLTFAEYAAKIKGSPNLLYGDDAANLIAIRNPDGTFRFERKLSNDDLFIPVDQISTNMDQASAEEVLSPIEQAIRDRGDASAFLATGGRVGFQGGGADASKSDFKTSSTTAKAPPSMGFGNPPPGPTGGGGGDNNQPPIKVPKTVKDIGNTAGELMFMKNLINLNPVGIMKNIGSKILLDKLISEANTEEDKNIMLADVSAKDLKRKGTIEATGFSYDDAMNMGIINPSMTKEEFEGMMKGTITEPTGQFAAADGGMPSYEGGIMDLESGRQMYFLGKLVKKATRAVKKIVKSPIGKAALIGGLGYFAGGGGNPFTAAGRGKFSFANIFSKNNPLLFSTKDGEQVFSPLKASALFSLSPLLLEEDTNEDEYQKFLRERGKGAQLPASIPDIRDRYKDYMARGFLAEGGKAEPVAKKTMPLLDMGGMEKDYRADGGFVPIGRMERADDVPARLSKNEFVFTADAVRNAGEGDIDKGAEVMYNMMKNLEAGGEVSEESQGLEGARKMFQTSQRLEEVL